MFDILGMIKLNSHQNQMFLPEFVFCNKPWNGNVKFGRHAISGKWFQVIYLKRNSDGNDYHAENGKHLLIIGEVFSNSLWLQRVKNQDSSEIKLSAEKLLHSYQENDNNFLHYLKGNFSLIILDEETGECRLFNSRFGISPFYYAMDGSRFIFSTSLVAIAKCFSSMPAVDETAVLELALFNYPLGDRTYFQKIKMLRPAEIIQADANGIKSELYWDVRTLYDVSQYSRGDALEIGAELFHKMVNQLASDVSKIRISFTSGFDSRAMLSVLEKDPDDYLSYSFGIHGSLNVTIPQQIAQQLKLSYYPILLDEAYESVFDEYAIQALLLSDCLSTVERANYPYAFELLVNFSPVVITGLFGSELMRTFQNVGHIVSASLVRLNVATNPTDELNNIMAEPNVIRYFSPNLLKHAIDDIEADINSVLVERFGEMAPDRRFYMFLLTEGLRKYFGAEIHTERLYGINRFPFLDDDFVQFLFHAPFAGVHSRTIQPTVQNRHQSQYFYAYIIRKYRPELLAAPTDHGYPPSDVLSPLALFMICPKQLYAKWQRRRNGYREFKTEEWTESLYKKFLFQKPTNAEWFTSAMETDFNSGEWLQRRLEFARASSLKMWLEMIQ